MKYSSEIPVGIGKFLSRYGFLLFSLGYLALAFILLPDYGIGFDSPKNFNEGWVNLNYLLSGHTRLQDQFTLTYQIHGAFFFMVADVFKRILSDTLGWLDPIAARHAFLPVLVFFFMNVFYAFLKKRMEARTAFLTCALILTTPHFWGHLFNNIKDIPLFVCFSLSLFSFYEWRMSGFRKAHYLYGAFFMFGLTLLSKLYAVLSPVIMTAWTLLLKLIPPDRVEPQPDGKFWTRQNICHGLLGLLLVLALLALFYMPAFYPVEEKRLFWMMKGRTARRLLENGTRIWSLLPWAHLFLVTPVLTLAAVGGGFIKAGLQKPFRGLSSFMGVWFLVIMLAACTPLFPVYHGIRLFLVVLVPFCFFAAQGIAGAAEYLEKISPLKKSMSIWLLGAFVITFQCAGIVQTHPYQTTFFNRLAGGLKGAQEKHIPDAQDYWLTSYREAVHWLNRNAPLNASLWVTNLDGFYIVRFYPFRKDLRYDFIKKTPLPRNSFLIMSPAGSIWVNTQAGLRKNIEQEAARMIKVHEIRRQGGEILSIYYKP